tara:strand:- start:323 stop:955 length:633 start_codon:yes stop_codon:yes gene_type:complete
MAKVKICGITNLEDALKASKFGADTLGFIFTKKSPRWIKREQAKKIIDKLDPFLTKAGVFLNQDKEEVLSLARELKLDILQFHGKESPAYCNSFKREFKIIKTLFPENRPFKNVIARFKIDAFLFDLQLAKKLKGSKTLPANVLKEAAKLIKDNKRIIISGGLNSENISGVLKLKPYAVDVCSGIEELVGKKNESEMRLFIKKVKNAATG